MQIFRATEWSQVEAAAIATMKCIRPATDTSPSGTNWTRAKQTWDVFSASGDVIYYIMHSNGNPEPAGYVRLLKVAGFYAGARRATYAVDFVAPYGYLPVRLAKDLHPLDALLVKTFGCEDRPFTDAWPVVRINLPMLDRYPYHQQLVGEADWMVVV
jgi:hypothetical protein